jgi:hypothetical protein
MEQLNIQLFLRIMKKAHDCVMHILTVDGERYSFQYMKEDRVWKVCHDADMVDFRRSVNKLVQRIGVVSEVSIKQVQ